MSKRVAVVILAVVSLLSRVFTLEEPFIEENDVISFEEERFKELLLKHNHVIVEFYAPWCGACQ